VYQTPSSVLESHIGMAAISAVEGRGCRPSSVGKITAYKISFPSYSERDTNVAALCPRNVGQVQSEAPAYCKPAGR
jgi:hypothetical protein